MKTLLIVAALAVLTAGSIAGDIVITLTVPDGKEAALIAKFCEAQGYKASVENPKNGAVGANPESRLAFAKRALAEWFLAQIRSGAVSEAQKTAAATAEAAVVEETKAVTVK